MSLRPSEQAERRRSAFKASVDAAEGRRRRRDDLAGVRKEGRETALLKKRCVGAVHVPHPRPLSLEKKLAKLPELVQELSSDDSSMQFEAVREFRNLLSIELKPPVKEVLDCGALPFFVQLLSRDDCPQLQFEAAWALSNIVSGTTENTKVVVQHGAVPIFVKLLSSPNEDVCEQAVWALGNVAGDSAAHRDIVLKHGALFPLLQLLNGRAKLSLLRIATWSLSNFCRGSPEPNFEHMKPALQVLRQLIHSEDDEIISDACWALYFLSRGKDAKAKIQAVIQAGACPRLVQLLVHPSPSVVAPSLRVVSNIARGDDDEQTQCIIDNQALPYLLNILRTNQMKDIKKEACSTVSYITAGNKEQIQAVINGNIIGPLVRLMETAEFVVRKEAAWAITNAISGGTHDQIKYIVSQGCIKVFCDLLTHSDTRILSVCLEGLANILKVGEAENELGACDVNMYAQLIEEADGLDKIEDLQGHDDQMIHNMAVQLLETFWSEEDDMPSEVGTHQIDNDNGNQQVLQGNFNFG